MRIPKNLTRITYVMIIIFWEMTPCGSYKNRRFGGSYRLQMIIIIVTAVETSNLTSCVWISGCVLTVGVISELWFLLLPRRPAPFYHSTLSNPGERTRFRCITDRAMAFRSVVSWLPQYTSFWYRRSRTNDLASSVFHLQLNHCTRIIKRWAI
jgi:hypothetical protein